ncbi:MAG: hypothetical protein JWP75_756 [Frondihabitans sp.]|nr:hypothetical protein [Frondihabitans sp.]
MIGGAAFETLDAREIQRLVAPLRSESAGNRAAGLEDVFAAACWSCLVEPGDAVGGLLRAALGPLGALDALSGSDDDIRARLTAKGVVEHDRIDLAAARARWQPRLTAMRFRGAFHAARVLGIRLVVPGDPEWPAGLDDLEVHGPAALWIRGDVGALSRGPSVAIVGSRAASAYGEQVSSELAAGVSAQGVAVHSGGAYGIDGMAHRAVLASGGTTVAVMAGGVDRFYPAGHHDLLSRIAERGAIVSEMPCGTSPSRWRFLQRNRLLAAATGGTVVVEAGFRSGALNTANHARSLDRPVGAVPGPVTSPASDGCHRLLREPDVTCITGPRDLLGMIQPSFLLAQPPDAIKRAAPESLRVLDALSGRRARDEAHVARLSGLDQAEVRATLAVLEIEGVARENGEGWLRVAR